MQTIGHDNKFHQVIVGRCTRGLQDKDILATHIFVYLDTHFTIAESANVSSAQLHSKSVHYPMR